MAFRRQQIPPSPRLPAQRKSDKTFLLPPHPALSFSLLSFFSLRSLFIRTMTLAQPPSCGNHTPLISLDTWHYLTARPSLSYSIFMHPVQDEHALGLAQLVPSDFAVTTLFIHSLFTDSDHPLVCTTCCMYTRSPARHGGYLFRIH